jgi:hypothetical protein
MESLDGKVTATVEVYHRMAEILLLTASNRML